MTLLITILGTYWLTKSLTEYDGPFGMFYKLRHLEALGALSCFVCSSLWVSAALSLLSASNAAEWVLLSLASAGGAWVLNVIVERMER